jgi:hypothetical protein
MIHHLGNRRPTGLSGCTALLLVAISCPTLAQDAPSQAPMLATGHQQILSDRSDTLAFAGKTLMLADFSGIFGMSSEMAYVVVVVGNASDGNVRAGRGQMLLIPPYGKATTRQRYDAARLLAGLTAGQRDALPALADLAAGQKRGIFVGRLGRTRFNAAAPGDSTQELAARTVKGAAAVQSIRFSGETDPTAIERKVVDVFLAALAEGDVETVAALMDPTPFGNTDLRGGADDARRLMARTLIAERAWQIALAEAQAVRATDSNIWTISGPNGRATLALRPMGDFVFVRTISMGDPS